MSTIEDTVRAYFTALDKADPAAAAAVFTTDARVMPDEMPTIAGAAGVQAVFESYFQAVHLHPEQLHLAASPTGAATRWSSHAPWRPSPRWPTRASTP